MYRSLQGGGKRVGGNGVGKEAGSSGGRHWHGDGRHASAPRVGATGNSRVGDLGGPRLAAILQEDKKGVHEQARLVVAVVVAARGWLGRSGRWRESRTEVAQIS